MNYETLKKYIIQEVSDNHKHNGINPVVVKIEVIKAMNRIHLPSLLTKVYPTGRNISLKELRNQLVSDVLTHFGGSIVQNSVKSKINAA